MKRNSFSSHRHFVLALLAVAASSTIFAQGAVQYKPPVPSGPIGAPNKLPPQLLPDLIVDSVTGSSGKSYAAKVKNIGVIPSAASNVYCAATVSNATHYYTIERVQPIPALNVNASHTVSCDFGSGAQSVKPGEKLVVVVFKANNGKVIQESNYANNELRTNIN